MGKEMAAYSERSKVVQTVEKKVSETAEYLEMK
jgi:hypothetical protein